MLVYKYRIIYFAFVLHLVCLSCVGVAFVLRGVFSYITLCVGVAIWVHSKRTTTAKCNTENQRNATLTQEDNDTFYLFLYLFSRWPQRIV